MFDPTELWIPSCPECGAPAEGTREQVPALARFDGVTTNGEVLWTGEVELDSAAQQSELDDAGRPIFSCAQGHWWSDETVQAGGAQPRQERVARALEALLGDDGVPARTREVVRWAASELRGGPRPAADARSRLS